MGFTIRTLTAECKFCEALSVEALGQVIPAATVAAVVQRHQRRGSRVRKLTWEVSLWVVVALHLFPRRSIPAVLRQVAHGQRLVWPDPQIRLPGASALVYRRYHLGVRPVVDLFHQVCRPLATPQTPGAFCFGLRLVGIDGTIENVPQSPANHQAFGRRASQHGPSAYPQVLAVYLVELGTHAIFEAGFWPGPTSEHRAARRLVRALGPGMLVLWDRGFHSVALLGRVRACGAHLLGRLPAHVQPQVLRALPDGSALVYLRPSRDEERGPAERGQVVRLVTYTLGGPGTTGERYRVVTTLLDPHQAPAPALAALYHERWEVEVTIDEIDTHQRLATRTLRSLKPVGILQELYGLLLAHYAVRALMHAAALHAGLDPDRLSFTQAVEVICAAIPDFQVVPPAQWPALSQRLLADLAQARLPARRPRSNPRVVRRQSSKFPQKPPGGRSAPRQSGTYAERIVVQHALPRSLVPIAPPCCFGSCVI